MKERLSQANTLTLVERLMELVGKCPEEIRKKYIADEKTFIKQIRDSRNYYTHYDKSGKKHILENIDLMILSERIRLIIVCNILLCLKFSPEDLVQIMDNHQYMFIHLKSEKSEKKIVTLEQPK